MRNEKHLKMKIKSYEGKINTKLHDDRMSKGSSYCIFLSVMLIDSVFKIRKNNYPPAFLRECEYMVKEKKINRHIEDDREISSDDSDEENSDKESIDV